MARKNSRIWCLIFCGFLVASSVVAQDAGSKNDISKLQGDWQGESICVNKEKFPACKDEVVVYHIKKVAGKANAVNLSADKIVNGKPEFMGAFDFDFDTKKQTLTTEFKNERVHLLIEFLVKGGTMEGSMMSLPDKTVARRIKVKTKT